MHLQFLSKSLTALLVLGALFTGAAARAQSAASTAPNPARFEQTVQSFEAADKASLPPKGAILLVGDSQFFRWKTLAEDLPGYSGIKRGVDSFQFADILHYFDRIVAPYDPRFSSDSPTTLPFFTSMLFGK
mgnify:CR=1 FL=1